MKNKTVQYREWEFLVDYESTKKHYDQIKGWANDCGCAECRNFAKNRQAVFPDEVLELFKELGIDYTKEAELVHIELETGEHLYNGWFHFAGSITKGADGKMPRGRDGHVIKVHEITENFEIGFTKEDLNIIHFEKGTGLVRVEFKAYLSWTIEEPETTFHFR